MRTHASSPTRPRALQQGFTMIEMAVVLIIVGLVVGGVMSGRSILEAAETRRVYEDAQTYMASIGQFMDKYGSLPGDMYDAESVWGQAAAAGACDTTNNSNKTTCNGNGNSQIELGMVVGSGGSETVEHLRAWQHLNNAGLLQVTVTGVSGAGGVNHSVVGVNVPEGAASGSGYSLYYQGVGAGSFFAINPTEVYGHILHYGLYTATSITEAPRMLPQEAWEVDSKVDDGFPWSGSVRTYTSTAQPNCASADTNAATYMVTYQDGRSCNLIFLTGF